MNFKGKHFPKEVILFAVYFHLRHAVSYQDLQKIMKERGVDVDDITLNRWVIEYSSLLAEKARNRKSPTGRSWPIDETYGKVKGRWMYQYRAVDKRGKILDFRLSDQREEAAAETFFKQAVGNNGVPEKGVIDKSGANQAGVLNVHLILWSLGYWPLIEILQVKYLNIIIEQDHLLYQEDHQAHERLQGLPFGIGYSARHRGRPHDPKTTVRTNGPVALQAIRGSRWMTVSKR